MVQEVNIAERVQEGIDLKRSIPELSGEEGLGIIFQDTSPPRRWGKVWSMTTGEMIPVPYHRLEVVLSKRLHPDQGGGRAFTSHQEEAPAMVIGTVKCFLAKDSPQREIVDQLNISPGYWCRTVTIPNELAAETHAEHRHPSRWKAYKAYLDRKERDEMRDQQRQQTEAILALASRGQAVESAASLKCLFPGCGREVATVAALATHMKTHEAT